MKKHFLAFLVSVLSSASILVSSSAAASSFSDVPQDAWYAGAVAYCVDAELMHGTSATTFSPDATTSRAMLVTILYRQAGSPQAGDTAFADVPSGAWYHDAVNWACEAGIASGYSAQRFGPNEPITREQLAALLWRSAGSPVPDSAATFPDQSAISAFAQQAAAWAQQAGIITGRDSGRFDPHGLATRAETAVILSRYDALTKPNPPSAPTQEEDAMPKLLLTVNGQTFSATLADTPTARALLAQLPLSVSMQELNGNEKYYYLPESLPTDAQQPGSIRAGDLMLYGADCLVLFYADFSTSYSYTRLGVLDDPEGLAQALGDGAVTISWHLA